MQGQGTGVAWSTALTPRLTAQVLQQIPGPTGPRLALSPAFASQDSQDKLEQFIRQFVCS